MPLVGFAGKLGVATAAVVGLTAAVTGSLFAISKWTAGVTESLDPLIQLSRTTRIAVGDIQALGFAASVSGSSADAMYSSIDSLSEKIGEAAQKGSEDFSRLGISVRDMNGRVKSAPEIINEVGAAFRRMNLSMPERRQFAGALGIDPTLVQLLSKSNSELSGLMAKAREMGVLTKEQADAAADYNDSITTLNFAMDALRQHIAVALAPEFREMVEEIIDLIVVNKEWISDGITAAVGALTELMKSIRRMMPILGVLTAAFVVAKVVTLGWAGAMALLFSPIVLITAGVAALWLVIDDLLVAFSGGKSVINEFFKEFLGVDLTDLTAALADMFMAVDLLMKGDFSGAWSEFKSAAQGAYDFVTDLFKGLFEGIAPDWIKNLFAAGGAYQDLLTETVQERLNELSETGSRMLGGGGTGESMSGRGRPVIEQNNSFSIQSNNPQAVADAVEGVLQRQLENNNAQLGVDAVGIRGGM